MKFVMNDKCSAGTGKFLEVTDQPAGTDQRQDYPELASKGEGVTISSMCTVFAESEVISPDRKRYFQGKHCIRGEWNLLL